MTTHATHETDKQLDQLRKRMATFGGRIADADQPLTEDDRKQIQNFKTKWKKIRRERLRQRTVPGRNPRAHQRLKRK